MGAASTDYRDHFLFDAGAVDPYLMTGNTLSLVSNRISYIFDLQGPSFTVDTACSSSLVAMDSAVEALQSGAIDTAIVGGVNALLSPFAFGGFCAAGMLSPQGLCRAFDADGAGYVRAEGAAAVVLQRQDVASSAIKMPRMRAEIVAAGINSDGKTVGVSLPSEKTQGALLSKLYSEANVDPNDLAFVEAHGTGTRVGDPAEATAIGHQIAQHRDEPLLIGSVKSNIGHLEPGAGLAGLLKAIASFEMGVLPASLHYETPNPDIPFEDLNIVVNAKNTPLRKSKEPLYAGVSTFGFGGTNAHAIIRDVKRDETVFDAEKEGGLLTLSAHGEVALRSLAARYAAYLEANPKTDIDHLSQNIARQRTHLPNTLAVRGDTSAALSEALSTFAREDEFNVITANACLASGKAEQENREIAFVFTGNGAQFAGMGREEYDNNPVFRAHFDRISGIAEPVFGWSASEMLVAADLSENLDSTAIAQPLLFVLQMAIVACLTELGISPKVSYGHSVGEVAAATCSGGLTLEQGIKVIHARSQMQETTRGQGKMAVGGLSAEDAAPILADIRSKGLILELAAINAPNAITVSGSQEGIEAFARTIKGKGLPAKVLDLDYGFHSPLMDPIESGILKKLDGLKPSKSAHIYVSTVTGNALDATTLDADYWWQNIRKPVLFQSAAEEAFGLGCRIFIEVGPRSLFRSNLNETLREEAETISTVETLRQPIKKSAIALDKAPDEGRHIELAALSAFAAGAIRPKAANSNIPHLELPMYPWQKKNFRAPDTTESLSRSRDFANYHCLLGFSPHIGARYWRNQIDGHNIPMYQDHKVDGKIIVPGAGYVEMMLAAASSYLETDHIEIRDMDIVRALELSDDQLMDTHTEISPDSSSVLIYSRSRLSDEEWTLNASARIAKIPSEELEVEEVAPAPSGTVLAQAETLYPLAKSFGLDYGPAFSRAESVYYEADEAISVAFAPANEDDELGLYGSKLLLNPTDLDVAFHGLVALYQELEDKEIKRGYIPIRFGRLRVFKAFERAAFARISVNSFTSRSIAADFKLYNSDGVLIAALYDARFRAASLVKRQKLSQYTYHFTERRHPHPTDLDAQHGPKTPLAAIKPLGDNFLDGDWAGSEPRLLLDAAAQRIAFGAASSLAEDGKLSFKSLLERGKLNPDDETRLSAFLTVLENAGFAESGAEAGQWQLSEHVDLPDANIILSTVMRSYPDWAAECVMLSHVANHIERDGVADIEGSSAFEAATLEQYYSSSPEMLDHIDAVSALVMEAIKLRPASQPVRILEIGNNSGGLSRRLLSLLDGVKWNLVCVGSNRRANGLLSLTTTDLAQVEVMDTDEFLAEYDDMAPFDLVVSANGLSIEPDLEQLLRAACRKTSAAGRFIVSESTPSTLSEVLFSYEEGWFVRTVNSEFPLSRQRNAEEWTHFLSGCGFAGFTVYSPDDESLPAIIIEANVSDRADASDNLVVFNIGTEKDDDEAPKAFVNIVFGSKSLEDDTHDLLASTEGGQYFAVDDEQRLIADDLVEAIKSTNDAVRVVDLSGFSSVVGSKDPQSELEAHVVRLNDLLKRCSDHIDEVVVVAPGGMRGLYDLGATNPVQTGVWTYTRTVRNEYPDVSIKTVDIDEALETDEFFKLLTRHVVDGALWSEAILSQEYCLELIAQTGFPTTEQSDDAVDTSKSLSTLAFEDLSGVDELDWVLADKSEPSTGEVQVEVSATGLNFRDVMWTLGILPDEALEDGFAGATLGFECAGRISAVGEGVADFKVGDPVIALGPACFSSHVTFDALSVVPLPEGIDPVAAASIPVAFLTAYYALHDLARLEEDEWVLIQGGAGGVGLAAIQIAQWRGANIIATAGTDEKRDLLRTLGVEHVFDSRSLDFVDQVMALTGDGIDCVLNSLFGEAMERGIELLKPFGRFLELGKRDYYGNTKIGLRPFRRNISYFGIDADQLLAQKPKIAKRLFAELMGLFDEDVFAPLPHRRFEGHEIIDAFRLMQKSGHIGKIVVKPVPPSELDAKPEARDVALSDDGHYVIIGGLGGFGLEVARWLANHGARHISLMGRSGTVDEEQAAIIANFAEQGVAVQPIACDAADVAALSKTLDDLRSERPIKGIIHAAMVLRDGLIANMSEADVADVLTPKVRGAFNIDHLTRNDPLDIFVLFSSITTFIGNPGQANYVAANGYLEGLARQRRKEGLPALAVGWGAISDVGYLARNEDVKDAISTRTGTQQFTAEQALNALTRLISIDNGLMNSAVLSVAPMDWEIAKGGLEILDTPSYVTMKRRASLSSQGSGESFDLAALIEGKTMPEARAVVSGLLAKEVSAVLRAPVDDINVKRPLTDLGMDSLMGVELRMSAQQKLGVDIPLASIANGVSIDDISTKIIEKLIGKQDINLNEVSELASIYLEEGTYEQEISSFDKLSSDEE
ncbi:MAG: type I polyketide synthase [Hyphomicrobiales bacterium]